MIKPNKEKFQQTYFQPISIIWMDSHEPANNSHNAEVESDDFPRELVIHSIGILVKETDESITLAGAYKPRNDNYDYVITIPKCSIIERRNLTCLKNLKIPRK